ncbi:Fmu (Sun) domain-containing protein [Paraflavitalea pollutisoli]|uniref:Fmu (Sun) domain-containing protein n=1 Tax=Paraflavitalea pollutisoli TaxID=3034143 RepID=UPI0023EDA16D|nr:Fmu (Sun) domain-containing protein [Paraflavitalea sp. H1-2-19X]
MKFFAHLNTAVQVLDQYKGQQPFGLFIKEFFRKDKKFGSRDRRSISHLCYCYFRAGKGLEQLPVPERIVAGLFLCSQAPNEVLAQLKPAWNEQAALPFADKWTMVAGEESLAAVFPWADELSTGMDALAFCTSFFVQPHLFLRCRPGKRAVVQQKLTAANITYAMASEDAIALPNASKVDEVIVLNQDAVVQDLSSQRVGKFLQLVKERITNTAALPVWDCCAASGGKSILAFDVFGKIDLTVSDIRDSIIANLKKRFAEAGITRYRSFVADLSNPQANLALAIPPVLILADVPCSGSGTWSRTPEQLFYFDQAAILRYQTLQKKIVARVGTQLPAGGLLLYITCSVFRDENEAVVQYMQEHEGLEALHIELLKGYSNQADTMFAALMRKS